MKPYVTMYVILEDTQSPHVHQAMPITKYLSNHGPQDHAENTPMNNSESVRILFIQWIRYVQDLHEPMRAFLDQHWAENPTVAMIHEITDADTVKVAAQSLYGLLLPLPTEEMATLALLETLTGTRTITNTWAAHFDIRTNLFPFGRR